MSISSVGGAGAPTAYAGSSPSAAAGLGAAIAGGSSDAATYLMNFTRMTPAEQMRASMLQSMGITQSQYDAMSPADKAKIDQKIQEKIKDEVQQQTEKKSGMIVDVKA